MKCSNCDFENSEEAKFCGKCGTTLISKRVGEMTKTSLGLNENIEGLLCYLLGWITGLIFLLLEKDSKLVKFHAIQSIGASLIFFVLYVIIELIGLYELNGIISLLQLIVSVFLMYKAYKGEKYKLPIVGDYAENKSA